MISIEDKAEEWLESQEGISGLSPEAYWAIKGYEAGYEAGKLASRRPRAVVMRVGNSWTIIKSGPSSDTATQLIRGGFVTSVDAKEWARSNGYEVC